MTLKLHTGRPIVTKETIITLIQRLDDPATEQKDLLRVIDTLNLGGPDGLYGLVKGLKNQYESVRARTVDLLSIKGQLYFMAPLKEEALKELVILLKEELRDTATLARRSAAAVLGNIAERTYDTITERFLAGTEHSDEILAMRARLAADVVPAITAQLRDPEPLVREAAAKALRQFRELAVSAIPDLKPMLSDEDPDVRNEVELTLFELETYEAKEQFIERKAE